MLPVIYAAAIFSVVTVVGLAVLRPVTNLALRSVLFVALVYGALRGTFWLSRQWDLDPVNIGAAWAVALLVVAIVEATRRARRIKQNAV